MIGGNTNLEFYKQIDNLNERIDTNTADKYSNTKTYLKDEYCIYDDTLYKANQDISTAEEFTVAHWDVTTIAAELDVIKSNLKLQNVNIDEVFTPEDGITVGESSYAQKIGNVIFIQLYLYKTDLSKFSGNRTLLGKLSSNIITMPQALVASIETSGYGNRVAGIVINGTYLYMDIINNDESISYITPNIWSFIKS